MQLTAIPGAPSRRTSQLTIKLHYSNVLFGKTEMGKSQFKEKAGAVFDRVVAPGARQKPKGAQNVFVPETEMSLAAPRPLCSR